MLRAWRVCLVVALVALAGCGGQSATPESTSPTLTPVPLTDDRPAGQTVTPERIFPGVTSERLVSPSTLVRAHADVLGNATVWFTYRRSVVASDGSVQQLRTLDGRVSANTSTYRVNATFRGPTARTNQTYYRDDETGVVQSTGQSGPEVSRTNGSLPVDPYFTTRLRQLLTTLDGFRVRRVDTSGEEAYIGTYLLVADRFDPDGELSGRNVSFRARVVPRGVVMSYQLRYEQVRNGSRLTVSESLTYDTVVFENSSR